MDWRQFITIEKKSGENKIGMKKLVLNNTEIKYFELSDNSIMIIMLDGNRRFYNLNYFTILRISQTR